MNVGRNFISLRLDVDPYTETRTCPGEHLHFSGCTKEVFKYMRFVADQDPDGICFATQKGIRAKIYKWDNGNKQRFGHSSIERAIKMLRDMKVIERATVITPLGVERSGYRPLHHSTWSIQAGNYCEVANVATYRTNLKGYHGNTTNNEDTNEDINEGANEGHNEGANEDINEDMNEDVLPVVNAATV
jgi:hypothetical protein